MSVIIFKPSSFKTLKNSAGILSRPQDFLLFNLEITDFISSVEKVGIADSGIVI